MSVNKRLEGTVVLVTGASSGDMIADAGGRAFPVPADITDGSQAEAAVDSVVSELGRLDVLVNNAGLMLIGPVAQAPEDEWQRMIDINLSALLNVTRAALPHLTRAASEAPRQVADIVNVSSTAGRVARAGTAVYSLTKFGVNAFSEGLRQELQAQRVRVAVVEPGTVDTELGSHVRAELRGAIEAQTKDMEKLRPEDIADAVAYIVTRPRHVALNELLVRAADQTW
jgi:NADP-dependent 3-hydroxy acid dehydrogenase YdfG